MNKKLDFEKRRFYRYLAYAFDGQNLIERISTIEVIDKDDEPPKIVTSGNKYYNNENDIFNFEIEENASIGHILNDPNMKFLFEVN